MRPFSKELALCLNLEFSRQTAAAYFHCAEYSHTTKPAYSKDHVVVLSNIGAAVMQAGSLISTASAL